MTAILVALDHEHSLTYSELENLSTHVTGVMIRATTNAKLDSQFYGHVRMVQDLRLPFGIWDTPDIIDLRSIQIQVNALTKIVDEVEPRAVCLNFNHYWMDWREHAAKAAGLNVHERVFGSDYILRFYFAYLTQLKKAVKLPLIARSSRMYIDRYCRPLAGLIRTDFDAYWNDVILLDHFVREAYSSNKEAWAETLVNINPTQDLPPGLPRADIVGVGDLALVDFPAMNILIAADSVYTRMFAPPVVTETMPKGGDNSGQESKVGSSQEVKVRRRNPVRKTTKSGDQAPGSVQSEG